MSVISVIAEAIVEEVRRRLADVEATDGVRVLLAVESGSRAWGFPSKDSDYDVRFVYIHPPDWYLAVDTEMHRDVIERPIVDEIDLSGWEIRKALLLFAKSNPPLLEWLSRGLRPPFLRVTTGENLVCRNLAYFPLLHFLKAPVRDREPEFLALGLRQLVETPQKMVRKGRSLFQGQLQGGDEKVFARHETIVSPPPLPHSRARQGSRLTVTVPS